MESNENALTLLAWYVELGADEAIGEAPANRYRETPRKDEHSKLAPVPNDSPALISLPPASTLASSLSSTDSVTKIAKNLATSASDLSTLAEALRKFDGCALRETATNLVFADGNPESQVMIIGEAPGSDEDREGRPFVGMAGQLLDRMLAAINLDRSKTYLSNILPWRPPGNRKPTPNEISVCLPFVRRHIELVKPNILVLVGSTSTQSLLGVTQGITRLRGRWHNYTDLNSGAGAFDPIPAMPIFHPGFLLRKPIMKREAWNDLREIRRRLDSENR